MEIKTKIMENTVGWQEVDKRKDRKRGPRTEPWGTPTVTEEGCDLNNLDELRVY